MSLLTVPVRFKEVLTTNVVTLQVHPYWPIEQFLNIYIPILKRTLMHTEEDIEIVEAGQNTIYRAAEAAPALEPTPITLKNKWGRNLNVSFYVRLKNYQYNYPEPVITTVFIENGEISGEVIHSVINPLSNAVQIPECVVCAESTDTIRYFGCLHYICQICINGCLQVGHNRCPTCRQNLR